MPPAAARGGYRIGRCGVIWLPALLPGGATAPDDHVMVVPRCDGRSCDESATSLWPPLCSACDKSGPVRLLRGLEGAGFLIHYA